MPEISVLIPLRDARGDAADHIRTWTEGQTLARDRYQVVVASDCDDAELDRAIAELLEPHDILHEVPGGNLMELWDAAARQASAPWLLITENHCEGDPACLQRALEGIGDTPELEAASLQHGHIATTSIGRLGARWFDRVYEEWDQPGEWNRLNSLGCVIRRESYISAGGLHPHYGEFSQPLLAARLDERGAVVSHLPEARVLHVHVDGMDDHHEHSASYALGECEAWPTLEPTFAERYFGYHRLPWNRQGLHPELGRRNVSMLARQAARATVRRPADLPWLISELISRLPAAMAGARPALLWTRMGLFWDELLASLKFLPNRRRFDRYLRAQEKIVRKAQLRWIVANPDDDGTRLRPGPHRIERISEGALIGVHGLEPHDGRQFRWSGRVLTVRLDRQTGPRQLRIDTAGLRGYPLASVAGVYSGGRRVARSALREEGSTLVIDLSAGQPDDVALLIRGLHAPDDERSLGLPIFSVDLRGAESREASAPREHLTVA